jgi:tetratricopeptide (TPR) repeat protein
LKSFLSHVLWVTITVAAAALLPSVAQADQTGEKVQLLLAQGDSLAYRGSHNEVLEPGWNPDGKTDAQKTRYGEQMLLRAIADYRQAANMRPEWADLYLRLASAWQRVYSLPEPYDPTPVHDPTWHRSDSQAVQAFHEALRREPQSFVAHRDFALFLLQVGLYQPAARQFWIASRLRPQDAFVLYERGQTQESLCHYQSAASLYQRAVLLSPHSQWRVSLGKMLLLTGRHGEAIQEWRQAISEADARNRRMKAEIAANNPHVGGFNQSMETGFSIGWTLGMAKKYLHQYRAYKMLSASQ